MVSVCGGCYSNLHLYMERTYLRCSIHGRNTGALSLAFHLTLLLPSFFACCTAQRNTRTARKPLPPCNPGTAPWTAPLTTRHCSVSQPIASLMVDRKPIHPQTPPSRVLRGSTLAVLDTSRHSPDPARVRVLGLLVYSAVSSLSLPLLGPLTVSSRRFRNHVISGTAHVHAP